jgi:hypothetical protein
MKPSEIYWLIGFLIISFLYLRKIYTLFGTLYPPTIMELHEDDNYGWKMSWYFISAFIMGIVILLILLVTIEQIQHLNSFINNLFGY